MSAVDIVLAALCWLNCAAWYFLGRSDGLKRALKLMEDAR